MNVVITRDVEADKQGDMTYVLEFTTEDGSTQSFETLHYETASHSRVWKPPSCQGRS